MNIQQKRILSFLKRVLEHITEDLEDFQEDLEIELGNITGDIEEVGDQYKKAIYDVFMVGNVKEKVCDAIQYISDIL